MVESKRQVIQRIIPLSVIIHCVHYCHPNKNIIKIQGYAWLQMVYISQKYTFLITIMAWSVFYKNSRTKSKIIKTEGLGKIKFIYMKHIQIQSYHMGIIFTLKYLLWQSQNVWVSTGRLCITTLEMCHEMLCQMS